MNCSPSNPLATLFGWGPAAGLALMLITGSAVAQSNPMYTQSACEGPYNTVFGQSGTNFLTAGDDISALLDPAPIPFSVFGQPVTELRVSTNGIITEGESNRSLANAPLPTVGAGVALYPFWDDLDADTGVNASTGIYWRQDGVAPNRVLTIEWYQVGHFNQTSDTGDITFQVRLFEGSNIVEFHYLDVLFSGTHEIFNQGLSATVGLEGALADPREFELHSFNAASLSNGQCIRYTPAGTVTPPVIVEGIPVPTLSRFSLALLVLSMLTISWIGIRRYT